MIRIFDEKETDFSHDGIEILDDITISCICERELNGTWFLNAEFLRDDDRSNSIENRKILKVPTSMSEQLFRIVNIKSTKSKITVYAEHIFFDNRHNFIEDTNVVKKDGNNALQQILAGCQYKSNFKGTSTVPTIASVRLVRKSLLEALMGDQENSFLNRWGGEIDFNNFDFIIKSQIGENRGVEVTYGHNMQGFEGEVDESGVVTRIMPMGYNGLLLPEKYVDSPLIDNYAFPKIQVVEISSIKVKENEEDEEGYDTEEEAFQAMRNYVSDLYSIQNIDKPSVNIRVNIISLERTDQFKNEIFERIYIGDTLKVNLEKYGFDVSCRIIGERYDSLNSRYVEVELGDVKSNILKDVTSMKETIDNILTQLGDNNWESFLEQARDEAAQLIQEGIKNSYVVAKKNEILIMDSENVETARNVIRMNKNGIAFSQTGYSGPYVIGITIDGKINADCITTGILNANLIRAGRLQSLNNSTWIDMESGAFSFANEQITFDGDNLKITIHGKSLEEILDEATFSVICNREQCIIVLDEDGTPSKNTEFTFEFKVNKNNTTEELQCVIKDVVLSSDEVTVEWTNTTNTVKLKAHTDTVFTNTEGSLEVTLETPYGDTSKTVYWNTVVNGIDASHVEILASGQVFFMNSNELEYTPDEITLTPNMSLCEFISWSYSLDGVQWVEVVNGENGLTIEEDSKKLIISNTCDIFTDTENSITFKVSCTQDCFDIMTIARLKDGDDAFSVLLDNESHTFIGNYEGFAVKDSIDISLIGFVGRLQVPLTIGNIYQIPTGMTCEIIDNDTIAPTLRVSVDTTFNTKNGTIIIPVTGIYQEVEDETVGDDIIVGEDTPLGGKRAKVGLYLEKAFSYSLSLDGTPASNVRITGSSNAFLSGDGGKTYAPDTLLFSGVFTECKFNKWQYWNSSKLVYEDVISGTLGLTLSDENLIVQSGSPIFNKKGGSMTLRLLSNIDGVHDIITVNKFTQLDNLDTEIENIRSEITQSNNNWKATFTTANSSNILFDGDFNKDSDDIYYEGDSYVINDRLYWRPFNSSSVVFTTNTVSAYPFYDKHLALSTTFNTDMTGTAYSLDLELKPNTDYVYQAQLATFFDYITDTGEQSPLSFWAWTGNSPSSSQTDEIVDILDYSQIVGLNRYNLCYVHFKTKDIKESIKCRLFIKGTAKQETNIYAREVCFRERELPGKYEGNQNEVIAGITTIDINGITVEHTEHQTKTQMKADGFFITDKNGEVIAELSNTEQWTQLKADKVFAKNIENVYEGSSNLYVDHSATVAGDGTSDKPFNSFAQLSNHLMKNPIINKDIYIVVRDPGFVINEQLRLDRLKGTGFIKITLEGKLVIANSGNGQYCIRLHQISKWVWITSGREFGSSTTGAVLQDGGDGDGHGIYATDVDSLEIDALTIACKNYGILTERSYVYTWHVDFGKCYNAIELRYQSIYYSSDDVGSCTDFVRLKSGSFAYWGCGTVRPQGNVQESNGLYYDHGKSLTPTASPRYPNSNPTPPASSGQVYTYTYNWTSHQTYQYQWSNWGDSDCKQGSWGYGLRGGHMFFDISTLRSQMSGTVQDGNTITLTRANSGGQSGGANVYINGSSCSSASGTPSYGGQTLLGTLSWGETKTFTLPKAIVQGLKNGAYNSLAVYVNSSASNCYLNIVNASITLKVEK